MIYLSVDASIKLFKHFQRMKSNQISDLVTKAHSISNDLANQGHNCWLNTVRLHLKNLGYNPDFITPIVQKNLLNIIARSAPAKTVNAINAEHGPTKIGKTRY